MLNRYVCESVCLDLYSIERVAECLMRKGKNIEAEKVLFEAVNIEAVWLHENHPNKIYSQNLYEKLKWSLWRDVVEVQYPTEYL